MIYLVDGAVNSYNFTCLLFDLADALSLYQHFHLPRQLLLAGNIHTSPTFISKPTKMAESEDGHHIEIVPDDSAWAGVEENAEDPEEVRVIFSALDSFL